MRLRLIILRHELPDTRILFSTSTRTPGPGGHQRADTIADLLSAVNALVPLESDHAWGLEDYIVTTVDGYECLHFQPLADTLQDNDEVVIRGLGSEELRERRIGGRFQISSDGRHLIDGTSWGRRWRGGIGRPSVEIPPRKRRRLNPVEDTSAIEQADEHEQLRLGWTGDRNGHSDTAVQRDEHAPSSRQNGHEDVHPTRGMTGGATGLRKRIDVDKKIRFADLKELENEEEEDDDSDDQDFEADEQQDDDEEDADFSDGGESTGESELEDEVAHLAGTDSILSEGSRLQITVEADFNDADAGREEKATLSDVSDHKGNQQALPDTAQTLHSSGTGDVIMESQINEASSERVSNPQDETSDPKQTPQHDRSFAGFSSVARESDQQTPFGNDRPDSVSKQNKDPTLGSNTESSTDEISDSDSTSADDESDDSSSSDDSSTDSSSSDSSSADSENVSEAEAHPDVLLDKPNVAPGEGLTRTHKCNERKRKSKLLARLKAEGVLPSNANFRDLWKYQNPLQTEIDEKKEAAALADRKNAIMARLSVGEEDQGADEMDGVSNAIQLPLQEPVEVQSENQAQVLEQPKEQVQDQKQDQDITPKRAKLDIASSRRMLFSSLGVRTPKTPEAEQALREKLAKPAREISSKASNPAVEDTTAVTKTDLWKRKLIISAVECAYEGREIEVPSFPFKHPWQIRREKADGYYQAEHFDELEDETTNARANVEQDEAEEVAEVEVQAEKTTSRTLTAPEVPLTSTSGFNEDRMIVHDGLPALQKSDLAVGAKIAYKEICMDANYAPQVSSYRVVTLLSVDGDAVTVQLSLQDRNNADENAQYDEETGERIYSKFDMPLDEEEEDVDDGIREITFEQMIEPKLVATSRRETGGHSVVRAIPSAMINDGATYAIEDTSIPRSSGLRGGDASHENEAEPSTAARQKVAIILEKAGINSAIDERLLQPITKLDDSTNDTSTQHNIVTKDSHGHQLSRYPPNVVSDNDAEETMVTSSQPSESMVESVRYPHLSLLEPDLSSLVGKSSSHQEAQRLSPTPVVGETTTFAPIEDDGLVSHEQPLEIGQDSLASEVPQTDASQRSIDSMRKEFGTYSNGINDANVREARDDEGGAAGESESTDSAGFPSLRSLTSSQAQRQSFVEATVSPPPGRRGNSRLTHGLSVAKAKASDWSDSEEASMKVSQSQPPPRLSQIPPDTSIVDLISSSPSKDSDRENVSRQGSKRNGATAVSNRSNTVLRKSFEGLGQSTLKKRKKRNF